MSHFSNFFGTSKIIPTLSLSSNIFDYILSENISIKSGLKLNEDYSIIRTRGVITSIDDVDSNAGRPFKKQKTHPNEIETEEIIKIDSSTIEENHETLLENIQKAIAEDGFSLALPHADCFDPTLSQKVEQFVSRFSGISFSSNLYLTPYPRRSGDEEFKSPRTDHSARSQGFQSHYDDHDVWVYQVSGQKHWLVSSSESYVRFPALYGTRLKPSSSFLCSSSSTASPGTGTSGSEFYSFHLEKRNSLHPSRFCAPSIYLYMCDILRSFGKEPSVVLRV
jgi:hypothetical protein